MEFDEKLLDARLKSRAGFEIVYSESISCPGTTNHICCTLKALSKFFTHSIIQ